MRVGVTSVALALSTFVALDAQQGDPTRPAFRTEVSLVEVATVVTDRDGHPIGDLTAADFEVLEDGVPRPLVSVRRLTTGARDRAPVVTAIAGARVERVSTNAGVADAPAFVLVLDDLNTSPYDAHRAIRAGVGALAAIPRDALVAVMTTSGVGGALLTLTPPGPEHEARVREFRGRLLLAGPQSRSPVGTTRSSVDAPCGVGSAVLHSPDCGDPTRAARRAQVIDAVAHILGQAGSRRKIIFWITEDMGVSPLDPRGNQAAQREALRRVLNADVAVYPVNPREGHADMRGSAAVAEGDRGDNRPDRRTGGRVRVGPGDTLWIGGPGGTISLDTDDMVAVTLDQIARESGGRWITGANDLQNVLAEIVTQNITSYMLAFEGAGTGMPGRHRIDVRVRRDGARVFARRAYFVADVPAGGPTRASNDAAALLRKAALGTAPQGQLQMKALVVPGFANGRQGRALVTVQVDESTAGHAPVDVAIFSIDNDGTVSEQQAFRMSRPDHGHVRELTMAIPLARGKHQVRVAAVTSDGTRSGLVMTPVEIVEPGDELLLAPPVLLAARQDGLAPTLTRAFAIGMPLVMQVELGGGRVREEPPAFVAALHDAQGVLVREADAALDPGDRPDRMRATAVLTTAGMVAGDYVLVVEGRRSSGSRTVKHAVPLRLHAPAHPATPSISHPRQPLPANELRPLPIAHGPSTWHAPVGGLIIRTEPAWRTFWAQLPTRQPPPDIDFARVTLLAFVIDSSAAVPVEPRVDRIEPDGDAIVVHWRAAPATPAATTHGRSFAVVGVLGHDGPVRFERVD